MINFQVIQIFTKQAQEEKVNDNNVQLIKDTKHLLQLKKNFCSQNKN